MKTPRDMTGCLSTDWPVDGCLYDTRYWPDRHEARRDYALNVDEPISYFHVRGIYARWLTPQEQWDDSGRERWEEREGGAWLDGALRYPTAPESPPDDWEPWDTDSVWTECDRKDDGAVRCWLVEWKGKA